MDIISLVLNFFLLNHIFPFLALLDPIFIWTLIFIINAFFLWRKKHIDVYTQNEETKKYLLCWYFFRLMTTMLWQRIFSRHNIFFWRFVIKFNIFLSCGWWKQSGRNIDFYVSTDHLSSDLVSGIWMEKQRQP